MIKYHSFYDLFMNFFMKSGSRVALNGGTEISQNDLIKKIFICILKMKKTFTGLERHEGEL